MAWSDLLAAFALYLVLEGLIPFASPSGWRNALGNLAKLNDGQLRTFGLGIMIVGLVLLLWVRG